VKRGSETDRVKRTRLPAKEPFLLALAVLRSSTALGLGTGNRDHHGTPVLVSAIGEVYRAKNLIA